MHKLFTLSFRRIANRLNQSELNALNVGQTLQNNKIPPSGEPFLYRLPREQLKHILNITCPINNLQDPSTPAIVAASKALRHQAKINEEKICAKCPFKQNCLSKKQPFTGVIENTPKDLLIFWSGLASLVKTEQVFYRHWVSAYKLGDNIIAALDDLSQGGNEIQQFQNLRLFMLKQNQENNKPQQTNQSSPKEVKKGKKKAGKQINEQDIAAAVQGDLNANQAQNNAENLQQQILGRDFSFDQVEEFEPQAKFSKDTYQQKKQPKQRKNDKQQGGKGYKFIQKNQYNKFEKNKNKFQRRQKSRSAQFQQEEEYPRAKGKNYRSNSDYQSDRRPSYENKRNDYNAGKRYRNQENYQRPPRYQNDRKGYKRYDNRQGFDMSQRYNQRGNNYRGGNKKYDNYQNRNYDQRRNERGQDERQYKDRRPNRNNQYEDSRNSRKYQNEEEYQPQKNQRQQKKTNKPNPFVEKWGRQKDFDDEMNFREFKQPKAPRQQNQSAEERRQAKQQAQAKPTVKIIQTENIQDRTQSQGRAGRNLRRRPRPVSNPDVQTTTQ